MAPRPRFHGPLREHRTGQRPFHGRELLCAPGVVFGVCRNRGERGSSLLDAQSTGASTRAHNTAWFFLLTLHTGRRLVCFGCQWRRKTSAEAEPSQKSAARRGFLAWHSKQEWRRTLGAGVRSTVAWVAAVVLRASPDNVATRRPRALLSCGCFQLQARGHSGRTASLYAKTRRVESGASSTDRRATEGLNSRPLPRRPGNAQSVAEDVRLAS
ncbi:hypothetical protein TRVL_05250 [Trypanosoma vivax]|nr:hypothetical protein TRVL_05250 [Trypanosoma vivax]